MKLSNSLFFPIMEIKNLPAFIVLEFMESQLQNKMLKKRVQFKFFEIKSENNFFFFTVPGSFTIFCLYL